MDSLMRPDEMTEEDIRLQFITPAITAKGWDPRFNIKTSFKITDGRIIVQGKTASRAKYKFADYVLYLTKNVPLAIIEAKRHTLQEGVGMQQAIDYALLMDVPFVYTANGDGFLEHDMLLGKERHLNSSDFPTPDELRDRFIKEKGFSNDQMALVSVPYYSANDFNAPRYYQAVAVNRAIEAIAKGQKRVLLVMATGTGKTFTVFQIVWRLLKAGLAHKILYLTDRNILADQPISQDFKPLKSVTSKISHRNINPSYKVYFALYQQLMDTDTNYFEKVKPEFFDVVIVDECHRGSAAEDAAWRKILDYFKGAIQIGMTATPKETRFVSNMHYFGEPLFTYSLKQGIDDGFLAPFKLIRIASNVDLAGYRPQHGQLDDNGNEIEDREYNSSDFDRNIILTQRTQIVARCITEWLRDNGPLSKTMVFCTGIAHAERLRQALVNLNSAEVAKDPRYVMRITGDDDEGKKQLTNFISVNCPYPVIATTSKLLTTGVDCKMCALVVIDTNINSMTEFKQIIGRGTRLRWEEGKRYFTVMDFRGATRLFDDDAFDGDPVETSEIGQNGNIIQSGVNEPSEPYDPDPLPGVLTAEPRPPIPVVSAASVQVAKRITQFYGLDAKMHVEAIAFFRDGIRSEFKTLDDFLQHWNAETQKQVIADELKERGILLESLRAELGNPALDDFDLICQIAFDKKPLTRAERIANVKKRDFFSKYEGIARQVLEALLDKYGETGSSDLGRLEVFQNDPFRALGSPARIGQAFGGRDNLMKAIQALEAALYAA